MDKRPRLSLVDDRGMLIPHDLLGREPIARERLFHALGHRTAVLWQELTTVRDEMGMTKITFRGLLYKLNKNEKFTLKRIERGLLRLRTAGLVVDQGRQKVVYRNGESWLLWRKVMGWSSDKRRKPGEDVTIMVPPATMEWVAWVEGHRGGKRLGSGAKKRIKSGPNVPIEKGQEVDVKMDLESGIKSGCSLIKSGYSTPPKMESKAGVFLDLDLNIQYGSSPNGEEQHGARPENSTEEKPTGELSGVGTCSGLRPEHGASRPVSFSFGKEAGNSPDVPPPVCPPTPEVVRAVSSPANGVRAAPLAYSTPKVAQLDPPVSRAGCMLGSGCPVTPADHDPGIDPKVLALMGATISPTLGIGIGNANFQPLSTRSWFIPGMPRYPDHSVMPPVYLPAPPLLPVGLTDLEAAEWLVKCYRGAARERTKKACWILAKRGEVGRSKHLPMLVQAARKLEDEGISPAAWAAFSFDVWLANDDGKRRRGTPRLPPLAWVFSCKRVDERVDWFYDELGGYRSRRVLHTRPAQDLSRRFAAFQMALCRREIDGETVEEIMARFFPGDLYDRMLVAAKAANQADQELANNMLARGEWLGW